MQARSIASQLAVTGARTSSFLTRTGSLGLRFSPWSANASTGRPRLMPDDQPISSDHRKHPEPTSRRLKITTSGIDQLCVGARAAARAGRSRWARNRAFARGLFNPCPEPAEGAAMIFRRLPHCGQCSITIPATPLSVIGCRFPCILQWARHHCRA